MSGYRRSFPKGTSERMCALMSEARNISELKRAQCIYFRSEHGLPPQQIADMVGFDVGTVRNLHSAFLRDGEAALKLSGKGGRYHAYLTEEEEASWLECQSRSNYQPYPVLSVIHFCAWKLIPVVHRRAPRGFV